MPQTPAREVTAAAAGGKHRPSTASTEITAVAVTTIWAWRHPRPANVEGICIGRTDAAVDPRRARRLAQRIVGTARQNNLPREIWTSPLHRCADVGRWLRRWGWVHHIDGQLAEMDFGAWEGQPWSAIPRAEIDAWAGNFAHYAAGGGESVQQLVARAGGWQTAGERARATRDGARDGAREGGASRGDRRGGTVPLSTLMVAHSGWMRARRWFESASAAASAAGSASQSATSMETLPSAARFPASPAYGELWKICGWPENP